MKFDDISDILLDEDSTAGKLSRARRRLAVLRLRPAEGGHHSHLRYVNAGPKVITETTLRSERLVIRSRHPMYRTRLLQTNRYGYCITPFFLLITFLSSITQAQAAPDLTSRNVVELRGNADDPRATTADGFWVAAGGDSSFDGDGPNTGIYWDEPVVTISGPWDGSGATAYRIFSSPSNFQEEFGASLSLKGEWLAVGSPAAYEALRDCYEYDCNPTGFELREGGKVYMFKLNGTRFELELEIAQGGMEGRFGQSVSLLSGQLLVGSPGTVPGSAHIVNPETGAVLTSFTSPDTTGTDKFGFRVVLTQELAIVGALNANAVYIYRKDQNGDWSASGKLSSPGEGSQFGFSIAADAGKIIVGAPGIEKAYIFEDEGTSNWPVKKELSGDFSSEFGVGVALTGDTVWVSSPRRLLGSQRRGQVMQYDQSADGSWQLVKTTGSSFPGNYDDFGTALYASNSMLTVLARRDGPFEDNTQDVFTSPDGIADVDGDLVSDLTDNCETVPNPDQANIDEDNFGDVCDIDIDGDRVNNTDEEAAGTDPYERDTDGDGLDDRRDPNPLHIDIDNDGLSDGPDNCPSVFNPLQENFDGDEQGDACDSDIDQDQVSNEEELAIGSDPYNKDTDGDGFTDSERYPLDFKNGWDSVYRFQLPDVYWVAAGDGVVLAASSKIELTSYAQSATGWQASSGPELNLNREEHLIRSVHMWGKLAAVNVDLVGTQNRILHFYSWSEAQGWSHRESIPITGWLQDIALNDDVFALSVSTQTDGASVFIYSRSESSSAHVATHALINSSTAMIIANDHVIVGEGFQNTVNFFPTNGGAGESITLRFSRIGRALFYLSDGTIVSSSSGGTTGQNATLFSQSLLGGAWSAEAIDDDYYWTVEQVSDDGRTGLTDSGRTNIILLAVDAVTREVFGEIRRRGRDFTTGIFGRFDNNGEVVATGEQDWVDIYLVDSDGDSIPDIDDNCRDWVNPNQSDVDGDGVGDVCEQLPPGC